MVPREGGDKREAALAQARGHTSPVRCGFGPLERQDEADRGAALDDILEQLDQLILPSRCFVRIERPNGDQLAGAVQDGRPSIG